MYCDAKLRPTSVKPTPNPQTGNSPLYFISLRWSVDFGAPENTFIAVEMTKRPCSIAKLLLYPVYGAIHYGSHKLETLITLVRNNILVPNFTVYTHVAGRSSQ